MPLATASPAGPTAVPPCDHLVEDLGLGGGAVFFRCMLCGVVLVVHEGRRWRIGPAEFPTGPQVGLVPRGDPTPEPSALAACVEPQEP